MDDKNEAASVPQMLNDLAEGTGGRIEEVGALPDGSGFAVLSMPLPSDHWLTAPGWNTPPMPFRKGTDDPERAKWVEAIRAAGRYAVRCATMNGKEDDFDPDAMVQNLVVGMLGYFTPDGLSSDGDANPAHDTPTVVNTNAARYNKLRGNHWSDGPLTLVVVRARDVQLGAQTFGGDTLDATIDVTLPEGGA